MKAETAEKLHDPSAGLLFVIDEDGIYRQVLAPSWLRDRLYLPADKLLGEHVEGVLPRKFANNLRRELRLSLESDELRSFEYELDVPAGTRQFEAHVSPCTVPQGGPKIVAVATYDITNQNGGVVNHPDRSGCVFYSLDQDLRVECANRAAEDYFDRTGTDILGESIDDMLPTAASRYLLSTSEDVQATGKPAVMELDYEKDPRLSEVHIYPNEPGVCVVSWELPPEGDSHSHPHNGMRDVRTVFESIPSIICRTDVETRTMTVVTDAVRDIFGHSPTDWRADPEVWLEAIHPTDEDRVRSFVDELWDTHEPGEIEYRIETPDGEIRWIRDQYQWEHDDAGDVTSALRIISDITETKRLQRQYGAVVDNLPGVVFRTSMDPADPPEYIHGRCQALTGYSCGGLAGTSGHLRSLIHSEDRERVDRVIDEARRHDSAYDISYRITTKDGSDKQLHEWGSPVEDEMIEGIILPSDLRMGRESPR